MTKKKKKPKVLATSTSKTSSPTPLLPLSSLQPQQQQQPDSSPSAAAAAALLKFRRNWPKNTLFFAPYRSCSRRRSSSPLLWVPLRLLRLPLSRRGRGGGAGTHEEASKYVFSRDFRSTRLADGFFMLWLLFRCSPLRGSLLRDVSFLDSRFWRFMRTGS